MHHGGSEKANQRVRDDDDVTCSETRLVSKMCRKLQTKLEKASPEKNEQRS